MAAPYLSEIRIMSFGYPPMGWARCDGQLLPISQNQALYSLLGTTYGGNGDTNFALPNLAGRVPIHRGPGYPLGQLGGEAAHVLNIAEVPVHAHAAQASGAAGDSPIPTGNFLGAADNSYDPLANSTTLQPATVSNFGSGHAHPNMQPFIVLNFCIATSGVFPPQN